jgi:hypothetical protein
LILRGRPETSLRIFIYTISFARSSNRETLRTRLYALLPLHIIYTWDLNLGFYTSFEGNITYQILRHTQILTSFYVAIIMTTEALNFDYSDFYFHMF